MNEPMILGAADSAAVLDAFDTILVACKQPPFQPLLRSLQEQVPDLIVGTEFWDLLSRQASAAIASTLMSIQGQIQDILTDPIKLNAIKESLRAKPQTEEGGEDVSQTTE